MKGDEIQCFLSFDKNPWCITHKGDSACCTLADKHYTRQSIGSNQFCRPGRNLVLRTQMGDAVWVTWNGIRDDELNAWECTVFHNESSFLSSFLVQEAVRITLKQWGEPPSDGIITYVDPEKVLSINPGYCFKCAGWKSFGHSKSGKKRLRFEKERL